ncbi:hAT dimerization domain-containing protein [Trifolium repens]|nr:hAT dimerization domain-containing protein [Trifolium repens]
MASSSAAPAANPTQPPPSAAPAARVRPKNAAGNKSDIAWQYAISIDEKSRRVMCKLCKHEFSGTAFRIKHHLAGTNKDVKVCTNCPPELRQQMLDIVNGLQIKNLKKNNIDLNIEGVDVDLEVGDDAKGKRKSQGELATKDLFKRGLTTARQTTINGAFKKEVREDGDLDDDVVEVEENEDEDGDLDDYQDFGLENILNI